MKKKKEDGETGPANVFDITDDEDLESQFAEYDLSADEAFEQDQAVMAFVQKKVSQKETELFDRIARLEQACVRRDVFLNGPATGILIWDLEGHVEFANRAAQELFADFDALSFRPIFIQSIRNLDYPLEDIPTEYSVENGFPDHEIALLSAIVEGVQDQEGYVVGVFLCNPDS